MSKIDVKASPEKLKDEKETMRVSHSAHTDQQEDSNQFGSETIDRRSSFEDHNESYPPGYTPTGMVKKWRMIPSKNVVLRKHHCPYKGCRYAAEFPSKLKVHRKTHTGEKDHHCTWPGCNKKFVFPYKLKSHYRTHTKEKPFTCNRSGCVAIFSQKGALNKHMRTHTDEGLYKCDFLGCFKAYKVEGTLNHHKQTIHENDKNFFRARRGWDKRFLNESHRQIQMMVHDNIKPFACDWPGCKYRAAVNCRIAYHRKTHFGQKNYECTYPDCNKKFATKFSLVRHRGKMHQELLHITSNKFLKIEKKEKDETLAEELKKETAHVLHIPHVDQQENLNKIDEETIVVRSYIQDHDHSYSPENTPTCEKLREPRVLSDDLILRKHSCSHENCTYKAKDRSRLKAHEKTHIGEKNYLCTWPDCNKKFMFSHQLKSHYLTHTKEKPYPCNWPGCVWAFSQNGGLKRHKRTHTIEGFYECDFPGCGSSFNAKSDLINHKQTAHEKDIKFVCELPDCNKFFLKKSYWKIHMKMHAEDKLFSCDWPDCDYTSIDKSDVTFHRYTHTGENKFECTYLDCKKRFKWKKTLVRHRTRCHQDLFPTISNKFAKDDKKEEGGIKSDLSETQLNVRVMNDDNQEVHYNSSKHDSEVAKI